MGRAAAAANARPSPDIGALLVPGPDPVANSDARLASSLAPTHASSLKPSLPLSPMLTNALYPVPSLFRFYLCEKYNIVIIHSKISLIKINKYLPFINQYGYSPVKANIPICSDTWLQS